MAVRPRAWLGDILVSTTILAAGVAGLLKSLEFPKGAAMWAIWVMALLVLCTALYILTSLWRYRATFRSRPASDKKEPG